MISSLGIIFLGGLAMAFVCQRLKLPRIVGMLATGVVVGPRVLNLLSPTMLNISSEFRQMALVIILIKAGLSLKVSDIKKVGRPAVLMSFVPAMFEIGACVVFAPLLMHISVIDAAIMGAVLGAVSPAVVVPRMVSMIEQGYGTGKGIPQLILAGASLDDVFVIVLFGTFVGMAQGGSARLIDFANIPVSIVLGIVLGGGVGLVIAWLFEHAHQKHRSISQSQKAVIILAVAFLLMSAQSRLEGIVSVSGLLAVMSMACAMVTKTRSEVSADLSQKFGRLWVAAEVILFVLVGAAVDIRYTLNAGIVVVMMIFILLAFRCVGVWICLLGTRLNPKEKLYCVIAYLPKATVQAAIGAVPLGLGLPCGNIVLSVAVVSIIITAPLGALCMDIACPRLLSQDKMD